MAVNNDIQRKAQLEVDEALSNHGGKLTYEALKEMQYLDCIIQGMTYLHSLLKIDLTFEIMSTCRNNAQVSTRRKYYENLH
jgi:hypothetical protein